jgi:WhiB family redox-sensing transcriptional regulator
VNLVFGRPPAPVATNPRRACNGADTNLFYPEGTSRDAAHRAITICGRCPLRAPCLIWALTAPEPNGVWGGVAERDWHTLQRRLHSRQRTNRIRRATQTGRAA